MDKEINTPRYLPNATARTPLNPLRPSGTKMALPRLLYKVKDSETFSRLEKILNLGAELTQLVQENTALRNHLKIQLLERFLSEQAVFNDERKVWLAKEDKAIAASSLQSAYDTEATYRKKAGKDHVGYVVNLAETCAEDNPVQIITHYQLEPNSMSDVEMFQKVLPELQETTPGWQ